MKGMYETFESFIYFKREAHMNIADFINEFERRYNKSKEHKFELSSSTRAFFLLNQANLSDDHKKLVRATLTGLEYDEMKTKLKKVFGVEAGSVANGELKIKVEDINVGEEEEDVLYGGYRSQRSRGTNRRYLSNRGGYGYNSRGAYGERDRKGFNKVQSQHKSERSSLNGFDRRGNRMKCSYCESIFHLAAACPEKTYYNEDEDEVEDHDIVLYQSSLLTEKEYDIFVAEASVAAILDSGASASVAGKVWLEGYLEGLPKKKQEQVEYYNSSSTFKFGSQEKFKSLYRVKIPAKVGSKDISIVTDVIESKIPLLLSKEAMKKADTNINFTNDTVTMLGEVQKVVITQSGHYAIPLNAARTVLRDVETSKDVKITLSVESTKDMRKIASKLHSQFGHPPSHKLITLLKRAGKADNKELIEEIQKVGENCQICKEFTRPSPKPVVGLPHATKFNETVAMDLKFYDGKIILHLIDHLTRFSTAIIVKFKESEEIIAGIFRSWIHIFGPPGKFLTDNGGEFANEKFLKMAETMNIRVMNTAAESPWSNGLVERHNATLAEILRKVMAEGKTDLETALAWTINAKNSLSNVHGFSPAQLAIGSSPQLPNVFNDKLPALEPLTGEDIITKNLKCMREARKAFIEAENSERIKRALVHNVRPSSKNKFVTGDIVFYKRNDCRRWKGPGKVIGHDSTNILIKHGANYVRAHACRVLPDKAVPPGQIESESESGEKTSEEEETPMNSRHLISDQDSSESGPEQPEREVSHHNSEDNQRNVKASDNQRNLKRGMKIEFKADGKWYSGEVVRRTGKSTGKFKDYWEIRTESDGVIELNMREDIDEWKPHEDMPSGNEAQVSYASVQNADPIVERTDDGRHECIFVVEESLKKKTTDDLRDAKQEEIRRWIEEEVYEEVIDKGQSKLSTTWVVTTKAEGQDIRTKARLVVRGYEEDSCEIRADSPTCSKDNIRMLLGVAGGKGWKVHSLDVKAAFLQGKAIDREIYVKPPLEFRKEKRLWRLKKVVYGLCDASRNWYLRVAEVLQNLGMKVCKYDNAVFLFRKGDLQGLVLVHVDDMLYFGTDEFLTKVVKPFKETFRISKEETSVFRYVGINVIQTDRCITLDQNQYLNNMSGDLIAKEAQRDKFRFASEEEKKSFRQGIGQLGWLTSISRPEASFDYCVLSTRQTRPQISDFLQYKKTVRDVKNNDYKIMMKKLDMRSLELTVFSDASFGNLSGGASQLGYMIFLSDKNGNAVPIVWASKKSKRVARSTLTAETLAAVEAVEAAVMCRKVLEDVLNKALPPIKLMVDNKSLYDTSNTTNVLADKRLMVDMSALRQMVTEKEVTIRWIPAEKQLADVLTKSGANKAKLTGVLASGSLRSLEL